MLDDLCRDPADMSTNNGQGPSPLPELERSLSQRWKRSKIWGMPFALMPMPVPEISTLDFPVFILAVTVITLPRGVYLIALSKRFAAARWIFCRSPLTRAGRENLIDRMVMPLSSAVGVNRPARLQ